jgi:hypothetical protein
MTLETVLGETPASRATWLKVTESGTLSLQADASGYGSVGWVTVKHSLKALSIA